MILRRMELSNIRSYSEVEIEFPMGKTLFEGDIGSGKSSILMAIEFAFFGLGSETGGSLLKVGEKEGRVKLVFDVDGTECEITRGLVRKGERVQQTVGRVKTGEEEQDLSPTELKEKILEILKFNEAPEPKAQSRIYRYAVYTPQEAMKSILVMAPEDRLQILRRAFGIEDYRVAAANSEAIVREVKSRVRELKSAAGEVEDLKEKVASEDEGLKAAEEKVSELKTEETELSQKLEESRGRQDGLRKDEIRAAELAKERTALRRTIDRTEEELEDAAKDRRNAEERVRKGNAGHGEPRREPPQTRGDLEDNVRELDAKSRELTVLRGRIEQKLEEYRSVMNDGVCPVCDRPVEGNEFALKERAKAVERGHVAEELVQCEAELVRARRLLQERIEYDSVVEGMSLQTEAHEESKRQLARAEDRAAKLSTELADAKKSLESTSRLLDSLAYSSAKTEELSSAIERIEKELRKVREESVATKAWTGEHRKLRLEYLERLARAEDAAARARSLSERQMWLEGYFAPTVGAIEKQVLTSLNQEFDSNFKRWFSVLIGDPQKEVRVDESFTPVISQEGYDQESEYLSGGERTSVALAYRLALNTLVQRVSTGMKSNILILDEPTDGFSKEQLGSVREILDELQCPQMIIVSHEKELESFADQIFRVTKSHGESRVEGATQAST